MQRLYIPLLRLLQTTATKANGLQLRIHTVPVEMQKGLFAGALN